MPNIAAFLKSEISRVARKELKAELTAMKKLTAQHRSHIAALRRELATVIQQVRKLSKSVPKRAPAEAANGPSVRFSAGAVSRHRSKLGLSAESYGALMGVSGQSIYKWEAGKARPQAKQLQAWAEIRKLGKREAAARLATIEA